MPPATPSAPSWRASRTSEPAGRRGAAGEPSSVALLATVLLSRGPSRAVGTDYAVRAGNPEATTRALGGLPWDLSTECRLSDSVGAIGRRRPTRAQPIIAAATAVSRKKATGRRQQEEGNKWSSATTSGSGVESSILRHSRTAVAGLRWSQCSRFAAPPPGAEGAPRAWPRRPRAGPGCAALSTGGCARRHDGRFAGVPRGTDIRTGRRAGPRRGDPDTNSTD